MKDYSRDDFETIIRKHGKSFNVIQNKVEKGAIDPSYPLFTFEDVQLICREVGKGFWQLCAKHENPMAEWGRERRARYVRDIILDAFK